MHAPLSSTTTVPTTSYPAAAPALTTSVFTTPLSLLPPLTYPRTPYYCASVCPPTIVPQYVPGMCLAPSRRYHYLLSPTHLPHHLLPVPLISFDHRALATSCPAVLSRECSNPEKRSCSCPPIRRLTPAPGRCGAQQPYENNGASAGPDHRCRSLNSTSLTGM